MKALLQVTDLEAVSVAFLKKYISLFWAVAAVLLLYIVFHLLGIGCPIKFVTGVSCAGCGMTRAWLHLLHFDLEAAFHFHPLFWSVPVVAILFLLKNRFPRVLRVTVCVVAVLFVVVYLIRMFDPACDIVVFEPHNSVFYRIVHNLI